MKIYTRRGDSGETDLYFRGRVPKDHLRIEACGVVDELNAHLGLVLATGVEPAVSEMLLEIQHDLFVLGSDLATVGVKPHRGKDDVPRVNEQRVNELERLIDKLDAFLEPMTAFILPGGCVSAAQLHVARTVCRRAERACTGLSRQEDISPLVVKYLNRLSDLLFVMARFENVKKNVSEVKWKT